MLVFILPLFIATHNAIIVGSKRFFLEIGRATYFHIRISSRKAAFFLSITGQYLALTFI